MEKIWIKKELYILNYEFLKFYAFFRFLYNFKLIFPYLNRKKGGILVHRTQWLTLHAYLTWRELTWHAGPPHGCDAALRPRGRVAGGPHEVQVAHKTRTPGRRPSGPRGSTWAPVWGATWQVGLADGGPTGIVGPSKRVGAVTQLLDVCAPLFNHTLLPLFFRVGLCSHTSYLLQATWSYERHRIRLRRGETRRSTRSPIKTRVKKLHK